MNDILQRLNDISSEVVRPSGANRLAQEGAPEPRMPPPQRFSGDPGHCRTFIAQCEIFFALQPSMFSSELSKVAFAVSLLSGRAGQWGTAEWERQSHVCSSFPRFAAALRRVFDPLTPSHEAGRRLPRLLQGNRSVDDYAIDFHTLSADCEWNERSLYDVFYQGLNDSIKDELAARDLPMSLNGLMELAARIDRRMRERRRERGMRRPPASHLPQPFFAADANSAVRGGEDLGASEPMQLGRTRITPEERERRSRRNLCFYCGAPGHPVARCPVKEKAQHQ
uniref:CCHC-type domain-containing protein n=1 Tax=Oryzias sinensis TaxID=183150 RepID=A0A8C7X3N2_9TELE